MIAGRPRLLVTRRLPIEVEWRLQQSYRVEMSGDDLLWSAAAFAARSADKDAILCTIGDPLNATVISSLPAHLRILANFGVGFDGVDVEAATRRGVTVTNTPGVLTDATADIAMLLLLGARPTRIGRRASHPLGKLTGMDPDPVVGGRYPRTAIGHRRHGADRTG